MQGLWISKWLEDIISRNRRTEAGEQLRDAFEATNPLPMLAVVSRLSMEDLPGDRVGVEFRVGMQKYDPPKGRHMVDWKGF
jgi:hypothetical protein